MNLIKISSYLLLFAITSTTIQAQPTVTIIGSGACLPMPHRKAPANLIDVDGERYLVDSGPGTLHALTTIGVQPDQLNGVFYSHLHLDHVGELANIITWFQVVKWTAEKTDTIYDAPPFSVVGPHGIKGYVEQILPLTPGKNIPSNIRIFEVGSGDLIECMKFAVLVGKTPHTAESIGYRFAFHNGKSLVITGDTGFSSDVSDFIQGTDIAILECSYSDEVYEQTKNDVKHLSPTTAGKLAQIAGVKKLVLTHLYPSADMIDTAAIAQQSFNGAVVTARDGMIISID